MTEPDVTVEARGVLCPVPIIRLARAARVLPPGSLVALLTDDPAAEYDVPAWCRMRGHALVSSADLPADVPETAAPTASEGSPGSEPHSPNAEPGQARRHLIRVGPAAEEGSQGNAGVSGSARASIPR